MFTTIAIAALICCALGSPQMIGKEIDERIVGGQPVRIVNHPYQISLMSNGTHNCGGVIISEDYIVTAAHCTHCKELSLLQIRAGSSDRMSGGQVRNVAEIHQHPKYDKPAHDYDIAILKLSESLQYRKYVQAIRLPTLNQIVPAGTEGFVTGWGYLIGGDSLLPTELQGVSMPLVSVEECKRAYGFNHDGYGRDLITPRMICAGHMDGKMDSCFGDSGGPLVADGMLVGLVSFGQGCAIPNVPKVFARVANLRDFIGVVTGI